MESVQWSFADGIVVLFTLVGGSLLQVNFPTHLLFLAIGAVALVDYFCRRLESPGPVARTGLSLGALAVFVYIGCQSAINQYNAEHPQVSLVYVFPGVWFPRQGTWYMRLVHYGPDTVYYPRITFIDRIRVKNFLSHKGPLSEDEINRSQTYLSYPEIDRQGGIILPYQFTWVPFNPSHEEYQAVIDIRGAAFGESLKIEQVDGRWRYRMTLDRNPSNGAHIIDCSDPGFPNSDPNLSACFPAYAGIPEIDTTIRWLPQDSNNRVMFLGIMVFGIVTAIALYALLALWLMGEPIVKSRV